MSKSRGFSVLKGVTIAKVNASAVNQVVLHDADGKFIFTIDVEMGVNGVPVMMLTKRKKTAQVPEKKSTAKNDIWPFPIEKDKSLG